MKLYPLMAKLDTRTVLIVGGGSVASRKLRAILGTGAAIRVVSPEKTPEISMLVSEGRITGIDRPFQPEDLEGCTLVFAATNNPSLNDLISDEAESRGIPVNNVTNPEKCSFFVPSQIVRGELTLAISTSGKSPATAKWLRHRLEKDVGPEYASLVQWMGTLRLFLERMSLPPDLIGKISDFLLTHGILRPLKANDREETRRLVERAFQAVLHQPVPRKLLDYLETG